MKSAFKLSVQYFHTSAESVFMRTHRLNCIAMMLITMTWNWDGNNLCTIVQYKAALRITVNLCTPHSMCVPESQCIIRYHILICPLSHLNQIYQATIYILYPKVLELYYPQGANPLPSCFCKAPSTRSTDTSNSSDAVLSSANLSLTTAWFKSSVAKEKEKKQ